MRKQDAQLQRGLKARQMNMIALGGVIGAGLFVGSGSAIAQAGPAAVVAYAVVGVLVVLIMRMLAELAVTSPETGSFASYARREIGPWAGFATGWCYAYLWAVIIGFEAVAGAGIFSRMVPEIPAWSAALIFMTILTASNLLSVRSFGELEFWFAAIKIFVIAAFLVLGVAAIIGVLPGIAAPGMKNLTGNGGFAPHGWLQVGLAGLVVVFSYFGTEVVTIAAGEAENPRESVRKALQSVVARILIFYVGSILVIVTLLPSTSANVTKSPFAATLDYLGIPSAAMIMDIVVITAVLSCLNSGIYTCSRIIFSLAQNGEAPRSFVNTNARSVPYVAVIASSLGGFITVAANYFLPTEALFTFLLESTGAMALMIYLVIAVSQIRHRHRVEREGGQIEVKMWGFPYVTWLVVVALGLIAAALAWNGPTQRSFVLTAVVSAIAISGGLIYQKRYSQVGKSRNSNMGLPQARENKAR